MSEMGSHSATSLEEDLHTLDIPGRLSREHAEGFMQRHSLGALFS
jgi:hypothetical protein